jgi:hypothetical protein
VEASHRVSGRLLFIFGLAAASAALSAPGAAATEPALGAAGCDGGVLEQPFLPWGDDATYVLAPDGGLEDGGAGWTLRNRARVVSGNEPYYVHNPADSLSLRVPAGSSATTPPVCIGSEHPSFRFFAHRGGSSLSFLEVEVLYEDSAGELQSPTVGAVVGHSRWNPTLPLPVVANQLLEPGEQTTVAFRFSARGQARWGVDDVYVDPHRH